MIKIMSKYGNLIAEYDWADLRDADLREADLRDADLRGANLSRADLSEADLSDADLRGADLRYADLRMANLIGADLRDADLRGADLSEADLIIITWMYWTVYITPGHLRIGCKSYPLKTWEEFSDAEISAMETKALEFWKENRELIIGLCKRFEKGETK